MNCPACDGSMEDVRIGDIEANRCPSCRGLWFDTLELEAARGLPHAEALDPVEVPEDAGIRNPRLKCPRCSRELRPIADPAHASLIYDVCLDCQGAFCDAGEFREYSAGEQHHLHGRLTDIVRRVLRAD